MCAYNLCLSRYSKFDLIEILFTFVLVCKALWALLGEALYKLMLSLLLLDKWTFALILILIFGNWFLFMSHRSLAKPPNMAKAELSMQGCMWIFSCMCWLCHE